MSHSNAKRTIVFEEENVCTTLFLYKCQTVVSLNDIAFVYQVDNKRIELFDNVSERLRSKVFNNVSTVHSIASHVSF